MIYKMLCYTYYYAQTIFHFIIILLNTRRTISLFSNEPETIEQIAMIFLITQNN